MAIVPHVLYWPGSLWLLGIYTDQAAKVTIGIVGLSFLILGLQLIIFSKSRVITRNSFRGIAVVGIIGLFAVVIPTAANSRIIANLTNGSEIKDIPLKYAGNKEHRFLVIGDTGHRSERLGPMMELIGSMHDDHPIEAAILLGDMLDADEPFDEAVQFQFIEPFKPLIDRGIPQFLALGNHEIYDGHAEGAIAHPIFNMEGNTYYARTFADGELTVFFLDSTRIVDHPAQLLWFRQKLAQTTSKWKVVAMHHGLMGSDINHGPDERRYHFLEPLLHGENGVDLVLSGHNHFYERMNPIKGTVFITSGHGSNPTHQTAPEHPETAFRMIQTRGFLIMSLGEGYLDIQSITEDGEVVDGVTLVKDNLRVAAGE
ncbi:MAG: metallophosphoesterase [Candidatus Sumerlaeia bacterium]|nr:metallophosphoesterase [Candidatus Sumerlaeia bacterium]